MEKNKENTELDTSIYKCDGIITLLYLHAAVRLYYAITILHNETHFHISFDLKTHYIIIIFFSVYYLQQQAPKPKRIVCEIEVSTNHTYLAPSMTVT